jgi:hypothetical protein
MRRLFYLSGSVCFLVLTVFLLIQIGHGEARAQGGIFATALAVQPVQSELGGNDYYILFSDGTLILRKSLAGQANLSSQKPVNLGNVLDVH